MPYDSSYLEPTAVEAAQVEAARLHVWARKRLNLALFRELKNADKVCGYSEAVADLCDFMKALSKVELEDVLSDATPENTEPAELALWWLRHQRNDSKQAKSRRTKKGI